MAGSRNKSAEASLRHDLASRSRSAGPVWALRRESLSVQAGDGMDALSRILSKRDKR